MGIIGSTFNQGWRSWVLGPFNATTNNAQRVTRSCASSALSYTAHPLLPFVTATDCVPFQLDFDFDTFLERVNETAGIYTVSAADLGSIDSTDLSAFKAHGGKLIVYHGGADGAFSVNATIDWYNDVLAGDHKAADYASKLFVVPGMNHCSGGPSTDDFEMFPEIINWVENGVAPDSVLATASNPGYFGVESRSRPLCPRIRNRPAITVPVISMSRATLRAKATVRAGTTLLLTTPTAFPEEAIPTIPSNSQNPNANPGSQSNGPGGRYRRRSDNLMIAIVSGY